MSIIKDRTEEQIELGRLIIKELIQRPQMPIGILAAIIGTKEDEAQLLVDDLEYRGSITKRVSRNFLTESECMTIQIIQDEIQNRLWEGKIDKLSLYDLETMLKAAIERKKMLDWDPKQSAAWSSSNASYLDELLKITPTPHATN